MAEHGDIFDLQVEGWKGLEWLAKERGVTNAASLKLPQLIDIVAAFPDFANEVSAVEKALRDRGHYSIIGAECHSELAFIEHNWAELKIHLRDKVDGNDATLLKQMRLAVVAPVNRFTRVEQNRKNARHCRDGTHAYRVLRGREGTNSVPPSMLAAAMKERKKQHRVPRAALVAGLRAAADLPITQDMLAKAQRVENLRAQAPIRKNLLERAQVRANRLCRRMNVRRYIGQRRHKR